MAPGVDPGLFYGKKMKPHSFIGIRAVQNVHCFC